MVGGRRLENMVGGVVGVDVVEVSGVIRGCGLVSGSVFLI
jgi:hypothetical protein